VALAISEVREIVERVFVLPDMLDACAGRDLGTIITILSAHGVTQGQIADLTGISQGRLSEWATHKRTPRATSSFEAFADGLGVPPTARQALGLAPRSPAAGPSPRHPAQSPVTGPEATSPRAVRSVSPRPVRIAALGLADLRGLDAVRDHLEEVIAVLEAEQGRKSRGAVVRRPAWKNLVFTGGAGSGKSRAAIAIGQAYRKLGVLANGHVVEAAAAELAGTGPGETATLLAEAVKAANSGILLINAAHDWHSLPDHGQRVLGHLYRQLTVSRNERRDELAVILSGRAEPLRKLLGGNPPLAARFRAVIDFPGYAPGQLSAIFGALADEAGLRLTVAARGKAAAVLDETEGDHRSGNARLAVQLLNQAVARQARRVAGASSPDPDLATLSTITAADIPEQLLPDGTPADEDWPGQYL
jgi:transcriptional regulator with XRE-family HTH domain